MPMVITDRAVRARAHWMMQKMGVEDWVNQISKGYDSDQASETYAFLGTSPTMREWVNERAAKTAQEYSYELKNKKFEGSVQIPSELLNRDKTGQVDEFLRNLAKRYFTHWGALGATVIQANGNAYDGTAFFSSGRSRGSNIVAESVVAAATPTALEIATVLNKVIEKHIDIKDDEGEPMNEDAAEFLILCPVKYRSVIGLALSGMNLSDGSGPVDNPMKSYSGITWKLHASPRFSTWSSNNQFGVFRTDGVSPIIRQEEPKGSNSTVQILGRDSDFFFDHDKIKAGVKASRNVGYGAWESAIRVDLSDA